MRYLIFIFLIAFVGACGIYYLIRYFSPNMYRFRFEEQLSLNKRMQEQLSEMEKKLKNETKNTTKKR